MIIRAQQGDTIDLICWRYYGRTEGITELVIEANPLISDVVLSVGQPVKLPDIQLPVTSKKMLQLWD